MFPSSSHVVCGVTTTVKIACVYAFMTCSEQSMEIHVIGLVF